MGISNAILRNRVALAPEIPDHDSIIPPSAGKLLVASKPPFNRLYTPCVATKSSEGLVPILLEIPRSQGLVPRGGDQPVSIPGGPAEGEDGVVMAVAASKRQLGLHLAGVLHVEVAIFIGEAQKLLEPWHWAEVHGVGGWFRIHLGAVHVRRYGGVVIVLGADEGGDESFVGESSGRRLKPSKLPGC